MFFSAFPIKVSGRRRKWAFFEIGTETMAGTVDDDPEEDEDESVCRLVNETVHFLLPENEVVVGGWGLVDAQNGGDTVDSVLLLTR